MDAAREVPSNGIVRWPGVGARPPLARFGDGVDRAKCGVGHGLPCRACRGLELADESGGAGFGRMMGCDLGGKSSDISLDFG